MKNLQAKPYTSMPGEPALLQVKPNPAKLALYWWLSKTVIAVFIFIPLAIVILQYTGGIHLPSGPLFSPSNWFAIVVFLILGIVAFSILYGWYYWLARSCCYVITPSRYRCTLGPVAIGYADVLSVTAKRPLLGRWLGLYSIHLRLKGKVMMNYSVWSSFWQIRTYNYIDGLTAAECQKAMELMTQQTNAPATNHP